MRHSIFPVRCRHHRSRVSPKPLAKSFLAAWLKENFVDGADVPVEIIKEVVIASEIKSLMCLVVSGATFAFVGEK